MIMNDCYDDEDDNKSLFTSKKMNNKHTHNLEKKVKINLHNYTTNKY